MIERLIENWLTSAGERGYEVPFAQLLASEGHRVIQGPVHHPFEHGKDILTFAGNGELHAYQLKGPDLVRLRDFEKIQGQLLALTAAAIAHPAITPSRLADRVFLVTNMMLTPPVHSRIEKFNISGESLGYPPIEPIERDQLLARFVDAHGSYLPQSLPDIRTLIELYYSDPASLFPCETVRGIFGIDPSVSAPGCIYSRLSPGDRERNSLDRVCGSELDAIGESPLRRAGLANGLHHLDEIRGCPHAGHPDMAGLV